jgi:hypothetical protein
MMSDDHWAPFSSKNLQDSQPAHVEEEDKTAQPQQSTGEERTRGDQVVLSGRDYNSTMQSEHTVQKTLNIGIMPSGHHNCKTFARQIKTGYCFKKSKQRFRCLDSWYAPIVS